MIPVAIFCRFFVSLKIKMLISKTTYFQLFIAFFLSKGERFWYEAFEFGET